MIERRVFLAFAFVFFVSIFLRSDFLAFIVSKPVECFFIEKKTVRGSSMEPFFSDGDTLDFLAGYYECHSVDRNDVILADYRGNPDAPIMKRVRAIPGDAFGVFQNGEYWGISVNGEEVTNFAGIPYRLTHEQVAHIENDAVGYGGIIPKDLYLVLGENPTGSMDSTVSGLFHIGLFAGRVVPTTLKR